MGTLNRDMSQDLDFGIMEIKALNPGASAQEMEVKITNNSWGFGSAVAHPGITAVINAGAAQDYLFIAAAGNTKFPRTESNNDVEPYWPVSTASPNIIAVAATNHDDQLATFIDLDIFGVTIFRQFLISVSSKPGFKTIGSVIETSMQDPAVSTACMKSAFPLFFQDADAGIGITFF